MKFNDHSNLVGQHAIMSPSNNAWTNYSLEKFIQVCENRKLVEKGTELHAIAEQLISHGIKLPKSKRTLNCYVNDAIGYRMTPEVVLFYSPLCFGTTDAISVDKENNLVRIHDLKTGFTPASFVQLEVYAALYCLEYSNGLVESNFELRIYQNDSVSVYIPDKPRIESLIEKIVLFDREWSDRESGRND